jgi:hypothetical protein
MLNRVVSTTLLVGIFVATCVYADPNMPPPNYDPAYNNMPPPAYYDNNRNNNNGWRMPWGNNNGNNGMGMPRMPMSNPMNMMGNNNRDDYYNAPPYPNRGGYPSNNSYQENMPTAGYGQNYPQQPYDTAPSNPYANMPPSHFDTRASHPLRP